MVENVLISWNLCILLQDSMQDFAQCFLEKLCHDLFAIYVKSLIKGMPQGFNHYLERQSRTVNNPSKLEVQRGKQVS